MEIVKGCKDFLGEEAKKRSKIRKIIVDTFESYGFESAETPIIEYEKFVKGENEDDEVISDLFKLKDKGQRDLALRYEFTFQLKRISKNKKLPYKRYQIGEVFRDEPASKNRLRQFTQCDVDVIGSDFKDETEILALCSEIMSNLGINYKIFINNRALLEEILFELKIKNEKKQQVLREIDKIDKIGEKQVIINLKKIGAEEAPSLLKKDLSYFKKFKKYREILEVIEYCKLYGIDVYFNPFLVRGLSYYNGTIFEIISPKIKESICGGGSYTINGVNCTGISLGLDRLAILSKDGIGEEKYLVVSLDKDKESIQISQKLRKKGKIVSIYYGKPSKALEYANSYNFSKVVFVGEKEIRSKLFKIKDMKTGKEVSLKI